MDETIKELALIDGAFIKETAWNRQGASFRPIGRRSFARRPWYEHAAAAAYVLIRSPWSYPLGQAFSQGRMFTLFEESEGRSL